MRASGRKKSAANNTKIISILKVSLSLESRAELAVEKESIVLNPGSKQETVIQTNQQRILTEGEGSVQLTSSLG
jgi:hypothetical protein